MDAATLIADVDDDANAGTAAVAAGVDTVGKAQATVALDDAIQTVSTQRGNLGALSNRLSSTISNIDQIGVNLAASKVNPRCRLCC